MLLSEDFVRAEDAYRRERFAQEREKGGLGRKAALALVIAGVVLAACGAPIEGPVVANPATSKLIVDLAPVGSPNISAALGYEFPEMFPVVANQAFEIVGYETPEMWPEAAEREYVEPSTGPR